MKKLKCWKKGKYPNHFHRNDGFEVESFGQKWKYPYIVIPKHSQKEEYDVIAIYLPYYSDMLTKDKTKSGAFSFAQKYMEEHDTC